MKSCDLILPMTSHCFSGCSIYYSVGWIRVWLYGQAVQLTITALKTSKRLICSQYIEEVMCPGNDKIYKSAREDHGFLTYKGCYFGLISGTSTYKV
jgi:hypothetical protein